MKASKLSEVEIPSKFWGASDEKQSSVPGSPQADSFVMLTRNAKMVLKKSVRKKMILAQLVCIFSFSLDLNYLNNSWKEEELPKKSSFLVAQFYRGWSVRQRPMPLDDHLCLSMSIILFFCVGASSSMLSPFKINICNTPWDGCTEIIPGVFPLKSDP